MEEYNVTSPSLPGDMASPGSQYESGGVTPTGDMGAAVGEILETQESVVFGELAQQDLRAHMGRIDEQLKVCEENRSKLRQMLEENPPPEEYSPLPYGMETEYTGKLNETRDRVRELFNQVAEKSQNNSRLLDEVLESRRQVTNGMISLFGAIDAEQAKLEEEIARLEAEFGDLNSNTELSEQKGRMKTELDKIKHDRCMFFGCIDLHPPELYNL